MDALKRFFGLVWILAGVALALYLPYQAITKLNSVQATQEDYVFWIVILVIFIPIIIGFILFGYYAAKGEYGQVKRLNLNSDKE